MFNFDDANKKSKEALDVAVKSYSAMTKGFQAIAIRRSPSRIALLISKSLPASKAWRQRSSFRRII
jgi:hypothetical protein